MIDIQVKRIYEPASSDDGFRVLVDRVWPRGRTKDQVQADLWLKSIAPSTALRKWFNHDRGKWVEFRKRYMAELKQKPDVAAPLILQAKKRRVTLLFSAKDTECNQAVVIMDYLRNLERISVDPPD